ncbi:NUDIX hydrolase [Pseudorhodoplanes sp.]|jgi:8-oxo-dGTP diphosphatase|uniref:NUDIX hydrolase n=1 Tax=Pseudorhodoplanes sp. TaxID=1934341 RepID=UPI002C8656E9|nr:NUDIX domain-containing protein [Pseudorhodoplanes sp.]HWV40760.1 NUDIX domain-containing protein [Pseudorhodoplanes sp.]
MKKKRKKPEHQPIEAAGGIVMRGKVRPLFAVVQLRRQKTWVLPKGKLNRDETAIEAARREAIEETGHDVKVHEFLGSLVYKASGRPKTVRFWRMQASARPVGPLMRDVRAVRWLSLPQAMSRLTHEREKLFLEKVGREILRQSGPAIRRKPKRLSPEPQPGRRKRGTASKATVVGATGRAAAPGAGVAMQPSFPIQRVGRRPPALIRKLWSLLRR